jgi:hypothetical protein
MRRRNLNLGRRSSRRKRIMWLTNTNLPFKASHLILNRKTTHLRSNFKRAKVSRCSWNSLSQTSMFSVVSIPFQTPIPTQIWFQPPTWTQQEILVLCSKNKEIELSRKAQSNRKKTTKSCGTSLNLSILQERAYLKERFLKIVCKKLLINA